MATHTSWLQTLATCALAAALGPFGCDKGNQPQSEPAAAEGQALKQAQPPQAATPPAPPPAAAPTPQPDAPSDEPAGYPRAGWSKVLADDTLPLCVFPNLTERAHAKTRAEVKPTKLAANASVTFGAFGPTPCIHESCDQLPTLQCYVEQEGMNLVVHTHYSGYHKL
jgi:hypothetical protein